MEFENIMNKALLGIIFSQEITLQLNIFKTWHKFLKCTFLCKFLSICTSFKLKFKKNVSSHFDGEYKSSRIRRFLHTTKRWHTRSHTSSSQTTWVGDILPELPTSSLSCYSHQLPHMWCSFLFEICNETFEFCS